MTQESKLWYMSKSKWAGILGGFGVALPGVISWLQGNGLGLGEIWAGVVIVLAVFGVRDLPVLNRK